MLIPAISRKAKAIYDKINREIITEFYYSDGLRMP